MYSIYKRTISSITPDTALRRMVHQPAHQALNPAGVSAQVCVHVAGGRDAMWAYVYAIHVCLSVVRTSEAEDGSRNSYTFNGVGAIGVAILELRHEHLRPPSSPATNARMRDALAPDLIPTVPCEPFRVTDIYHHPGSHHAMSLECTLEFVPH